MIMDITQKEMIEYQLKGRDITDPKVIKAMENIDRALFVPSEIIEHAYEDRPLPIGKGQTISQPYIVAYMAQELRLNPNDKVLEIGTGCGYNAAVLSQIVSQVFSIEIIEWLASLGKVNLAKAGVSNVVTQYGDGYQGWPENAPFDAIMLTAAPPAIPEPLKEQLKIGGKLLAPVGETSQQLILLEKISKTSFRRKTLLPVQFVPMTGEAQRY
jgi:protein-L-isoaspartate(D-aspartate) O-methyltransferase